MSKERAKKIAEGLAAAERGQKDLVAAEARVEELVKAARERALAMEHQAQARANQIVEAAKQTAQSEAARLMEAAHAVCPYSQATRSNIEVTLRVA